MQVSKATRVRISFRSFCSNHKNRQRKTKIVYTCCELFSSPRKKNKKRVNRLIETAATCRYSTEQLSLSCQKRNHTVERTNSNNERIEHKSKLQFRKIIPPTRFHKSMYIYTTIILSRWKNKKKQQTIISNRQFELNCKVPQKPNKNR